MLPDQVELGAEHQQAKPEQREQEREADEESATLDHGAPIVAPAGGILEALLDPGRAHPSGAELRPMPRVQRGDERRRP